MERLIITAISAIMAFSMLCLTAMAMDERTIPADIEAFEGRELTIAELENVNKELNHLKNGKKTACPATAFLRISFKGNESINLTTMLMLLAKEGEMPYVELFSEEYDRVQSLYPGDYSVLHLFRISRRELENFLKSYSIISLDRAQMGNDVVYDEKTGNYYINFSSNVFLYSDTQGRDPDEYDRECIYGKTDGETVMLLRNGRGEYKELVWLTVLRKFNGRWLFIYNGETGKTSKRNTYEENGWQTSIKMKLKDNVFPRDPSKSAGYNTALVKYNEYIREHFYSEYRTYLDQFADDPHYSLISPTYYGLTDVNFDGIPEMVAKDPYGGYGLFGLIGGNVERLDCSTENGQHGYTGILNNGYSIGNHYSTQDEWYIYKYNRDLSADFTLFGKYWRSIGNVSWLGLFGGYKGAPEWTSEIMLKYTYNSADMVTVFMIDGEVVSEYEYNQRLNVYKKMIDKTVYCDYSPYEVEDPEHVPYYVKQIHSRLFY